MALAKKWSRSLKSMAAGLGMAAGLAALGAPGEAQAPQREIIVTIKSVVALDKLDAFSKADFVARVTIAGEAILSPVAKQSDRIAPNWRLAKQVRPGRHAVKLEILDKDVTKLESIDVNRVLNKRDLDFVVDTRNCIITGFTQIYRCGQEITRGGTENKKAEVVFVVEVR